MAAKTQDQRFKAMVRYIRVARQFFHRSYPVTRDQVGRFRRHACGFLREFGGGAEPAKFESLWDETFIRLPITGNGCIWKDWVENNEAPQGDVQWCHPELGRQALYVLIDVLRRVKSQTLAEPKLPDPPASFRTPRGEYIWRLMEDKKFHTELELSRAAKVDPATVSRFVRGENTPPGRRPTKPRLKILEALGIGGEHQVPK